MTTPPPSPPRRWPWLRFAGLVLLALVVVAAVWRNARREQAIRDLHALGLEYYQWRPDVRAKVREGWHNLFKRETWHVDRAVQQPQMILKFDPPRHNDSVASALRCLSVEDFNVTSILQNVDALNHLPSLKNLSLSNCFYLQNVDALHHLPSLKWLSLSNCPHLQNVDGLAGLTSLEGISLPGCTSLRNLDGLKRLTGLHSLELHGCTALENVDALSNLPALTEIRLIGCTKLPFESITAIKVTHPSALIIGPNGEIVRLSPQSTQGN